MSAIALKHGGTIDKFVGDAMPIFFGDPESRGERGDAKAFLTMAWEMQKRLVELNQKWRSEGVEEPFRARMGINSGYCNVGNFGSTDRMDYTVIGAEANLAARLQSIAELGRLILSYEAYALVSGLILAHPLPSITMKGISREVISYVVDKLLEDDDASSETVVEQLAGLNLYLDPAAVGVNEVDRIRKALSAAIAALDRQRVRTV